MANAFVSTLSGYAVWLAGPAAGAWNGFYTWANRNAMELMAKKNKILGTYELVIAFKGLNNGPDCFSTHYEQNIVPT